jgi:hypothetical protein
VPSSSMTATCWLALDLRPKTNMRWLPELSVGAASGGVNECAAALGPDVLPTLPAESRNYRSSTHVNDVICLGVTLGQPPFRKQIAEG